MGLISTAALRSHRGRRPPALVATRRCSAPSRRGPTRRGPASAGLPAARWNGGADPVADAPGAGPSAPARDAVLSATPWARVRPRRHPPSSAWSAWPLCRARPPTLTAVAVAPRPPGPSRRTDLRYVERARGASPRRCTTRLGHYMLTGIAPATSPPPPRLRPGPRMIDDADGARSVKLGTDRSWTPIAPVARARWQGQAGAPATRWSASAQPGPSTRRRAGQPAGRGDHQRSPTRPGRGPSMSSQRSTRSVSWLSVGTVGRSADGTTPRATGSPPRAPRRRRRRSRRRARRGRRTDPGAPAPRQGPRDAGRAASAPTARPRPRRSPPAPTPRRRRPRAGRPCGAGRTPRRWAPGRQHRGQGGLVDLHDQLGPRPAAGGVRRPRGRAAPRPAPAPARGGRRGRRAPCRRAAARRSRPASTVRRPGP